MSTSPLSYSPTAGEQSIEVLAFSAQGSRRFCGNPVTHWKNSSLRPPVQVGLNSGAVSQGPKRSPHHAKQCSPPLQMKPHSANTYLSHLSTERHQPSHRKTREKRSVSVVHNCAEKNSERPRKWSPARWQPTSPCASPAPFQGRKLENPSPETTGSPAKSGDLSIVFFYQQQVRT